MGSGTLYFWSYTLSKGLVERVFEINFEESPYSTLRDGSIIKELQNLGAD